ncbi:MBL fold metallo-hydrolase [Paenisporosarcina antarctica]|uniref:MBL fold metallo-hydrolase n=1 Tax=Paenisporosarcina antarctica TaxID=417367 RepID=A0A4P6ZX85_9BACL|nr:MBL fold metallo-hydrolase [Paenisporosarcina antarctica]QBP41007.1 MBL fold metallo-hydrolase [Paenisporosarcina antarctica]
MIHKLILPTPFAVGDVNAYLLKGDSLSLIDAGPKTPEAYEALERGIKEAGYSFNDIEQVFLTHHHPDHAGWIDAFPQAKVYGHVYNDLWLTRDPAFFAYHDEFYLKRLKEEGVPEKYHSWVEKMKRPVSFLGNRPLDETLAEGDVLPGHPGWTVLETLGHAQSHISFWHPESKVMIGGDHILEKISSNPLIEPPLNSSDGRPKSMLQYNASLKRVLSMPVEKIYSGHGNEVFNVHELIEHRLERQHERAMKVHSMISQQSLTIYEITQKLFPTVYEKELGLTLSETIGQVDYLLSEGLAFESSDEYGVFSYARA